MMTDAGNGARDAPDEDLEGLDESQRAEVHEYEAGGRIEGDVLVDMAIDRGESLTPEAPEFPGAIVGAAGSDDEDDSDPV